MSELGISDIFDFCHICICEMRGACTHTPHTHNTSFKYLLNFVPTPPWPRCQGRRQLYACTGFTCVWASSILSTISLFCFSLFCSVLFGRFYRLHTKNHMHTHINQWSRRVLGIAFRMPCQWGGWALEFAGNRINWQEIEFVHSICTYYMGRWGLGTLSSIVNFVFESLFSQFVSASGRR